MFDFFRNNIKLFMGLLMLLIIPSFVFFGIQGYSGFREGKDVVAKVGKIEITRQEWDVAHQNEVERTAANVPGIDRALLDTQAARDALLERMVNDRVLALAAQDGLFSTSDQRLARELSQDPAIAGLRKADGSLDVERYRDLLRAQGMTPEGFEAGVRADLARRQVTQGIQASSFLSEASANRALQAFFERREVQVAYFKPADFRAGIQLSDADVQAFYDQNRQSFQTPEQVDVEYVVLDLDAVARSTKLNDSDVRAYYEQNNANLAQQEQRRARHILLTVDAAASAEDKAKVRAQADALLAELRQSPDKFAELARTRSQDPGSAQQGGDLDYFGRGAMVKPFEDAAFALDKGKISEVVPTEFGFHIIQVTDIRRPEPEPFEKVRARLEADLVKQQAQRRFAEVAEEFSNMVYEQSDALKPAADKFGLTVKQAMGVLRSGPTDAARDAVLANPKVLSVMFSGDALGQKRNSQAIEVGANQMLSVRVLAHRQAAVRPLTEVSAQVRERLLQQKALEAARQAGQTQLAAWQAAPASAVLRPAVVVSRGNPLALPAPLLAAALSAAAGPSTAAWASADLGSEGFAVVRVNRVLEREPVDAARSNQERSQLAQMWAQVELQAYLQSLRAHYKAQITRPVKETTS